MHIFIQLDEGYKAVWLLVLCESSPMLQRRAFGPRCWGEAQWSRGSLWTRWGTKLQVQLLVLAWLRQTSVCTGVPPPDDFNLSYGRVE
jgi:hypothetical protein